MEKLPIDYKYKEWSGVHDWNFWEESLPIAFDFFEKA
jgi:S-formylglutathione hydrolase FrmB